MSEKRKKSCKEFFGERLKLLRAQKGISQEALAKKLGISKGSLGFYETCKNTPDIEVLNAVSNFFNVSLDYLLGYTENPTNDTDLQAVCNYTALSEKAVKSLLMAKDIGNDWLHSTIEFVLEDLFEEVKARLEYPLTKVDEFTPVQIAGSNLLTGLMCYFNVQSSENTSPIQNFVLISPNGQFIDENTKGINLNDLTELIATDKVLIAEKIYYDEVCSSIKRAKKLYLDKKGGENNGKHNPS